MTVRGSVDYGDGLLRPVEVCSGIISARENLLRIAALAKPSEIISLPKTASQSLGEMPEKVVDVSVHEVDFDDALFD